VNRPASAIGPIRQVLAGLAVLCKCWAPPSGEWLPSLKTGRNESVISE